MSKRVIALLLAVSALFVVVGCGSDDDEGSEETLTKVEFIKQGDKICDEATERAEGEGRKFAKENGFTLEGASNEQIEEVVTEVLVPAVSRQTDEIAALGTPEGDEETIEEMLAALDDGVAEVEDDPGIVIEEGEPLKEATQIARDYGFKSCGEE